MLYLLKYNYIYIHDALHFSKIDIWLIFKTLPS